MPRIPVAPPEKVLPADWRDRIKNQLQEYRLAVHPPDGSKEDKRQKKADTIKKLILSAKIEEGIKELLGVCRVKSLERIRLRDGGNGIDLLWWAIEQCAEYIHFPNPKEMEEDYERIRKTDMDPDIREMAADAIISIHREKPGKGPHEKEMNYLLIMLNHGFREKLGKRKSFNTVLDYFVRATFGGRKREPESVERQLHRVFREQKKPDKKAR